MTSTFQNIENFGYRELWLANELLETYINKGLPEEFHEEGITIMMNHYSGYVFFTNSDFQVAMLRDGLLEMYYTTPYAGYEGFADELLERIDQENYMHPQDIQFIKEINHTNE